MISEILLSEIDLCVSGFSTRNDTDLMHSYGLLAQKTVQLMPTCSATNLRILM